MERARGKGAEGLRTLEGETAGLRPRLAPRAPESRRGWAHASAPGPFLPTQRFPPRPAVSKARGARCPPEISFAPAASKVRGTNVGGGDSRGQWGPEMTQSRRLSGAWHGARGSPPTCSGRSAPFPSARGRHWEHVLGYL